MEKKKKQKKKHKQNNIEKNPEENQNSHYQNQKNALKEEKKENEKKISEEADGDPRLKVFKRDWFQGKDCLDIGCNSAKEFRCKSILGIDIDSDRVSDAYWHLRKFARTENARKNSSKAARLELTNKVNGAEHSAGTSSVETKEEGPPSVEGDLFDVVSFRQENFVQSQRPPEKQYDTILWWVSPSTMSCPVNMYFMKA
ncbi:unnamed protein product [Dovyalis caffra]|uniref:RNA methyltransferase n=1 Tax=Dovyalis caffra TaxID=77055 RepID=A0AAV1RPS1_9ROSI|nr:unnamed protein product [Dovyalis caffra]